MVYYGLINCRIWCYLFLFVFKGCLLCVNGEKRKWKEGEFLLFDDFFFYEAWYIGTDGERVVFMLDFWYLEFIMVEREVFVFMFLLYCMV